MTGVLAKKREIAGLNSIASILNQGINMPINKILGYKGGALDESLTCE